MRTSRRGMLVGMFCSCSARFGLSNQSSSQDITGGLGLNQGSDVSPNRFKSDKVDSFACNWSSSGREAQVGDQPQRFLSSSGNGQLDVGIERERGFLSNLMGARPDLLFVDEGSDQNANAFATTDHVAGGNAPDGSVVFGLHLIKREQQRVGMSNYARWDHVCAAILAHEMGHITQFQRATLTQALRQGKYRELHADFLAGWYMARRSLQTKVDLTSPLKEFFSIGDYQFNSPGHHGTPQERWACLSEGMNYVQTPFESTFRSGLAIVSQM